MSTDNLDLGLLDISIEDIETLPGYETPYPGDYILKMTSALKKVNTSVVVETAFEVVSCVKKNDDADPDSPVGTKFSNIYTIVSGKSDPEQKLNAEKLGKGKLKELLIDVAEATGQTNLAVLVRDVVGSAIVAATVNRRKDKEDPEKFYPVVKNLRLA